MSKAKPVTAWAVIDDRGIGLQHLFAQRAAAEGNAQWCRTLVKAGVLSSKGGYRIARVEIREVTDE